MPTNEIGKSSAQGQKTARIGKYELKKAVQLDFWLLLYMVLGVVITWFIETLLPHLQEMEGFWPQAFAGLGALLAPVLRLGVEALRNNSGRVLAEPNEP